MSKITRPLRHEIRIFVSYAHADPTIYKGTLEALLRWPDLEVLITCWSDKDIVPGSDPDKTIREQLTCMDIFVALITPMFAASRYIHEVELPIAKRRYEDGHAQVVPIVVEHPGPRECDWLLSRELLPDKKKCWNDYLMEFPTYDRATRPIRDGLRRVIDETLAKKAGKKR